MKKIVKGNKLRNTVFALFFLLLITPVIAEAFCPGPFGTEINLEVPFTTQAPYANWDEVHEETCEEASALNVHYYYQGKTFTPDIADQELQDLIAYENDTLGFYKDTTAQQTADL